MYAVMVTDEADNSQMYGPFDRFDAFKFIGEMVIDTKEYMEYYLYELKEVWKEKYNGQRATCS